MINNSHNKYIIFILLQSFLYGLGNPLTKIAFASITPLWCLAFRFGLAFSLFAIFFATRLRKQLQALSASQYLPAGLCMASAYISCNLALEGTTATNVGFIMSLSVIFAPLLSIIVLQRPYKLSHLPIQLLVILGMYLLCSNGGTFSFNQGDLWALLTAVSVAGALVFGEKSLKATELSLFLLFKPLLRQLSASQELYYSTISALSLKFNQKPGLLLSIWLLHVPAWLIFCKTLP